VTAWFLLGESRRRVGDVDQAIRAFEKCLELDDQRADALFSLGTIYFLRQDRQRATGYFRRLLTASPRHAGAHYQLGKLLLSQGNLDEAILHLRQAVEIEPRSRGAHYQLARAYRLHGNAEAAEREGNVFRELGTEVTDEASWRRDRLAPIPKTP
jgi:tetratricopeptide (TPR) repeat protein